MIPLTHTSHRRGFFGRAAAGLAALAAGGTLTRGADARTLDEGSPADEAWIGKIRGKHRQVFDCTSPNSGFGAVYALNWMDSHNATTQTRDGDLTAIVVLRHFAMPLALSDAVWAKYGLGQVINVSDGTNGPATRNIFHNAIMMRPGLTYEKMIADRGAIFVACNMALAVISSMVAQKAGVSAEQAKADFVSGLIPGVALAHSGVYAVNRAQEKGCSYCYGG